MEPGILTSNASEIRNPATGAARLSALERYGLALVALLAILGFLLTSHQTYGIGFPLDDAWIHQTYARNLGQYGEWAFVPGQPSAGSTAPLWSALLALGYLLRASPLVWAYLLGMLSLVGLGLVGEHYLRAWLPGSNWRVPLAGLFLVGEWHLVWAALSGMETLLAAGMILLVLLLTSRARGKAWGWVGLLVGASVWVRPDGITLLGPAVFTLLWVEPSWRARLRGLGWLAGGVGLCFAPYLLFNLLVQGSIWPNTFYAKQAEYAVLREAPLLLRFARVISLPLIGAGLFLLPGFLAFAWTAWQKRSAAGLAAVIWFLGYGMLYALRLPVTYQYGRYFMPAMPVFFVLGLAGTLLLARQPWAARFGSRRAGWVLGRVALFSTLGVWLAFYASGASRYGQDVAIIETEMVASARWVAENTPAGTQIAAHDIGALGYFAQRPLLDLAGLVSPEVIPFIRDEAQLARWLDENQAEYLLVIDGWYPHLADGKPLVFNTNGRFAPASGGGNMLVYRWK